MRQCMWKRSWNFKLCFTCEELLGLLLLSHPKQSTKGHWRQATDHINIQPIFKSDFLCCHPSLSESLICVLTTIRQHMLWAIISYIPLEYLKWRFISFPRKFGNVPERNWNHDMISLCGCLKTVWLRKCVLISDFPYNFLVLHHIVSTLIKLPSSLEQLYHPESVSPFYPTIIKYDVSSSEGQEMKYPIERVG